VAKYLYNENHKALKKETEEDTRRWKTSHVHVLALLRL
jgi:hypothetical protein